LGGACSGTLRASRLACLSIGHRERLHEGRKAQCRRRRQLARCGSGTQRRAGVARLFRSCYERMNTGQPEARPRVSKPLWAPHEPRFRMMFTTAPQHQSFSLHAKAVRSAIACVMAQPHATDVAAERVTSGSNRESLSPRVLDRGSVVSAVRSCWSSIVNGQTRRRGPPRRGPVTLATRSGS